MLAAFPLHGFVPCGEYLFGLGVVAKAMVFRLIGFGALFWHILMEDVGRMLRLDWFGCWGFVLNVCCGFDRGDGMNLRV